jgi:hypothetical protein
MSAIKSELTTGAVIMVVLFCLVAAVLIYLAGNSIYDRKGTPAGAAWLIIAGIVCLVIAFIPYYYKAPPIPTINRVGSTIVVTNYSSLGTNPTLEVWTLHNGYNTKLYDMKDPNYNATNRSWNHDTLGITKPIVVRNYVAGLVFSQSDVINM